MVVDANIVLNAAIGRSRPMFEFVSRKRLLATSARAREEVLGRAVNLGVRTAEALEAAVALMALTAISEPELYAPLLPRAADALRLAPASRNGSTADAHVPSLAWTLDADIWSHDRDFAGTGWPSWSSANLRAALADP
jgi:predicted nucleic acid-binding protein